MGKKAIFKQYLEGLSEIALRGDAREESFYGSLGGLIEEVARVTGRAEVRVTTLPKPTEAGNPDFRVWNGSDRIIGYIEAKRPTEERLSEIERSEQLERYLGTFPNLILTNFLEFRLYRGGELVESVLAARPMILNQVRAGPPIEKPDELWALLEHFLDFSLPQTYSAEMLAVELAKRARFLRDVTEQQLNEELSASKGKLLGFYEAFQAYLIGDLTPHEFADLYAQTITYGLFAARTRSGDGFNRRAAFHKIPHMIGILRDVFRFISLEELPPELEWIVDDISEVLAVVDAPCILDRYYHEGKGSDPIVHFYETFLARYDPEERERRGVYYTPEPVVSYIVRSLHHILKEKFEMPDGLASDRVTLLDPAAGTMTFVARAAQEAVSEFEAKYGSGGRAEFIRKHILRNFYAFELMMAPYAVGHLKMSFFLEELGHRLGDDERVKFYLTNALEMLELEQSRLPGFSSLAEESHLAGVVKKEQPVLVILGNPPYSGHSSNRGEWILGKIGDYKQVDGKPLGEKNPKWLQDDYVKFLRFAQWKIDQAGRGIVGMITNHSYLDNPTFRGMRRSLMNTFDEIYILDLHGNSLKKEICPDGSKDENVFDIRQGVAIAFFVKTSGESESTISVFHGDVWGTRKQKYDWLLKRNIENGEWHELRPRSEFYLFVPQDEEVLERYTEFVKINDIFPISSVGIVTARDKLTIHWSADEVWRTVNVFSRMDAELARKSFNLGKDVRDWKVEYAQNDLKDSGPSAGKVVSILYRPFDVRYTYYTGKSRGFLCMPRPEVMRHMLAGENRALITVRKIPPGKDARYFLVANYTVSNGAIRSDNQSIDTVFPLYLYSNFERRDLFAHHDPPERRPNISPDVIKALEKAYDKEPSSEDIFNYIYAVFYAQAYREKYKEFLKIDFPRVPFTSNGNLFRELSALGERLVGLHLLKSHELDTPVARFEGRGDGRVAKSKSEGFRYDPKEKRVYINTTQYFATVLQDIWEYRIGGYQVCEKWLKDRRERSLGMDDIKTYCRIVTALEKTIEIQKDIDALYPRVEASLLHLEITSA